MPTQIIVPHLGESITQATLVHWHKKVGDRVKRGEELADIETEKATMPLECPKNGEIIAILVEAGAEVTIGEILAVIGKPGEVWSPAPQIEAQAPAPPQDVSSLPSPATPDSTPIAAPKKKIRISPLARRRARELGVDLKAVSPTQGTKIEAEDVERFAATQGEPDTALPSHVKPLSELNKIVGQRMVTSVSQAPQFSVTAQADAQKMLEFRRNRPSSEQKIGVTTLLVHFVAQALIAHPLLNSEFHDDKILVYDVRNVGIAAATADGLRVPVIHDADTLTISELDRQIHLLSEKARRNQLRAEDIADGTFTVSNLGMFGVTQFTPIINPPQAAILGIGAPTPQVRLVENGDMQPVQLITLTITADHRVIDGVEVANFLSTLKTLIENCVIDL